MVGGFSNVLKILRSYSVLLLLFFFVIAILMSHVLAYHNV